MTVGEVADNETVLRRPNSVGESRPLLAEAKEEAEDMAEGAFITVWVE